ncbi:MAG: type II toxin-antitoxin system Phd/YefM family antitoxin [Magnetococcales bacterium]|nr:type II toxin-antitoxin system Phd/YefM family antitoxin [Magnetococcales bacterium]
MAKSMSYTAFRKNLSSVMAEVERDSITYQITKKGSEGVVVMSQSDFNSLNETLYLLSSSANREKLRSSMKEAKAGEFVEVDL